MSPYIPLRVHSYYSLLAATASPAELVARAAAEGMTHLALTDCHALYGAVAFARACEAAGVTPILGLTINVAWPQAITPAPPDTHMPGQLVLLARDASGYRSLCQLSSHIQSAPDRDAKIRHGLSLDLLAAHHEGLICLTGGRKGFVHRSLYEALSPQTKVPDTAATYDRAAHRFLGRLCGIYGPERTLVSLELQTLDDQQVVQRLSEKATLMGLQTVAVHPVYTLRKDDEARLRLLAAIDRNCPLGEVPPTALPNGGDRTVAMHWLGPDEMRARYAAFPEALARTVDVAQSLGAAPALPDGTLQWPALDLPEDETPATALRRDARAGAEKRYASPLPQAIAERLERELTRINARGYAPLFLAVADIVRFARAQDIPVSTRGSVANSLVAYALRITTVDPIAHGLLFERFLSPGRADPPDIDLDFCSRQRDEVQAYIRETYGEDRVALVGAMSTLQLRSAGRETAKAYGLSDAETSRLLALLPRHFHPRQPQRTLEEVLADLGEPWLQAVAKAAYDIAGFPHHLSIHAGGLVITPGPLTDLVPVQMAPKGFLTTQYDHGDCEAIGLPKLDLLGIRALTVLADAAEAAREADPVFRLDQIPLDDPTTAALLREGDTVGVFQCDSVGARRTLRKLRAHTVADLAIANAFFKPGPATGGQANVFVSRYREEAQTRYQHPALEPILAATKGVLIFQEQVLRVATEVAGLSWAQADHIRRGMSRMAPGEMRELADAFIQGCMRPDGPGFTEEQAQQLWTQVSAFSGYGFNQGHATAYADVSYRSAYMKAHYPAAFFWARLSNYGGYHHPTVYMAEAVRYGIDVRIPHVNHSFANVTLSAAQPEADWAAAREAVHDHDNPVAPYDRQASTPILWLGLGLVRDLRRDAIAGIVRARRRGGPYTSLRDLLLRVPLQPKEITHLIQCGALDGLEPQARTPAAGQGPPHRGLANRPAMLSEARTVATAGNARQLAFEFAAGYAPPASLSQHLAWERHLLGYPLAALRLALPALKAQRPDTTPIAALPRTRGPVVVTGVRLPGWHRDGYALWDGGDWCWTEIPKGAKAPPTWEPVQVRGHWRQDRWGIGWMLIERWQTLSLP
ncbi:MAG: DNA polymerase III subunit alpha [Anaerolineae bacterium]|nr:DNA polymerase III subunit alpha [Anaerolineae bacterium]